MVVIDLICIIRSISQTAAPAHVRALERLCCTKWNRTALNYT